MPATKKDVEEKFVPLPRREFHYKFATASLEELTEWDSQLEKIQLEVEAELREELKDPSIDRFRDGRVADLRRTLRQIENGISQADFADERIDGLLRKQPGRRWTGRMIDTVVFRQQRRAAEADAEPAPATTPYRAAPHCKFLIDEGEGVLRRVKPREIVHLSPSQYAAFQDQFQPIVDRDVSLMPPGSEESLLPRKKRR